MDTVVCGHACTCCNCCNLRPSGAVLALAAMLVLQTKETITLILRVSAKVLGTLGSALTECKC
jgi:hypothetical protein